MVLFTENSSAQQKGQNYNETYKIIVVGDSSVGKTHLISQYVTGTLPNNPKATMGVEFATRLVPLEIGGTVKAMIWDTAGQEHYKSISRAHFKKAVGALLVYDITAESSFLNAANWLDELRTTGEPDIVIMLVGNKVDCVNSDNNLRQVEYDMAAAFANKNNMFFCEVSATQNINVKEVFEKLLQEVYHEQSRRKLLNSCDPNNENAYQRISGIQLMPPNRSYLNKDITGSYPINDMTRGCC